MLIISIRFQIKHQALIILISGPAASGKSTIATLLARSFGIPAVINTDSYWDVLRFYNVEDNSLNFEQSARKLKPHIIEQIKRRIKQRKSIIIEGSHIQPLLYSQDIQQLQGYENSLIVPITVKTDPKLQELLNLRHPFIKAFVPN
jgi:2-phosphoglycerate kinase